MKIFANSNFFTIGDVLDDVPEAVSAAGSKDCAENRSI